MLANLPVCPAFKPKLTDQVLIFAATGGTKSTLVATLTLGVDRLVAIDGKGSLTLPGGRTVQLPAFGEGKVANPAFLSALHDALRVRPVGQNRLVLRVAPEDIEELAPHDAIFRAIFEQGNRLVWLDEVSATGATANICPRWLKAISARGRTKGLGIITCSQQPFAQCPMTLRRNANFTLFGPTEVQDLEKINRKDIDCVAEIAPYSGVFVVYKTGTPQPSRLHFTVPASLANWQAP